MISPDRDDDPDRRAPVALMRRGFRLDAPVLAATLRATARGLYEAELNGHRVGDEELAPGWTSYRHRLAVQEHDVTHLVTSGDNALGFWLADGWWRGHLTWTCARNTYGTRLGLLAELEVRTTEGTVVVGTDGSWRSGTGAVLEADLYMGEVHDARLAQPGWSEAGFDDATWVGVRTEDVDRTTLVRTSAPPVRVTGVVHPRSMTHLADGAAVVDLGQNLVGRLRLRNVDLPAGTEVVLRHAEVLEDGRPLTRILRGATQTDRYVAAGTGDESWAPRFTTHGFRYAEITGWPAVTAEDVVAEVLHSDLPRTGWFSCSDPRLVQLHDNAVWSLRGNTVSVPTDCPQRDERLGWTGDIQVFAPSACFLYDMRGFLRSWLLDLQAEQLPTGEVPWVVPNILDTAMGTSAIGVPAAWADAVTVVPWVLWERYGDRGALAEHHEDMKRFVTACVRAHGPDLDPSVFQFGDWCDPDAPLHDSGHGKTEQLLVAGAYLVRSAEITAATAAVLGEDPGPWQQVADDYRAVWQKRFVLDDSRCTSDAVTAYALGICFGLHPDPQAAGDRLAQLSREAGHRITTGFVGTPLVCDALERTGHLDEAYAVLTETSCPSFLYPVLQKATTIWERWDSLKPDGTVNTSTMTSFNHYALGAIVDWLHRTVAGLAPEEPGYRRVRVRPRPGGGLTSAAARLLTDHGTVDVSWVLSDGVLRVEVQTPVPAVIDLPWLQTEVGPGNHTFSG